MPLFKKVAIVGVGLIGGSLGLAIKKKKLARSVLGVARHKETIHKARKLGAIDHGGTSLSFIQDADLIILATPISHILKELPQVVKFAKKNALLMDVASTKNEILKTAKKYAKNKVHFIGCHPLAGSEKRGIDNANVNLFKGALCILTPLVQRKAEIFKIQRLWHSLGARTCILSSERHDRILAYTSHLPHALAFCLMHILPINYFVFSATGLKDTTRIAASDFLVWKDIFLSNKKEVISAVKNYQRRLNYFLRLLSRNKQRKLENFLATAKLKRDSL